MRNMRRLVGLSSLLWIGLCLVTISSVQAEPPIPATATPHPQLSQTADAGPAKKTATPDTGRGTDTPSTVPANDIITQNTDSSETSETLKPDAESSGDDSSDASTGNDPDPNTRPTPEEDASDTLDSKPPAQGSSLSPEERASDDVPEVAPPTNTNAAPNSGDQADAPSNGTTAPVDKPVPADGTTDPANPQSGDGTHTVPSDDVGGEAGDPSTAVGGDAIVLPESTAPQEPISTPVKDKPSIFRTILDNGEITFSLTTGYRKDHFQWSIAGNSDGTNPNILSELTWTDVDSYQITLANRSIFNRRFYLRGELNYAFVKNGSIQDSDYKEDGRGDEYSRSYSESSGDQIWDITLGCGYPFYFFNKRLLVAPLLGYAYHKQNFRITDGKQVITSGTLPALGPLQGLESTYRTAWVGPWAGVDLRYYIGGLHDTAHRPMELGLSFEFHYADYDAEANWNLRQDLEHPVSFEHLDTGIGIEMAAEWLIHLAAKWDLLLHTTYQLWETNNGTDRVFYANGTVSETRLNKVTWQNYNLSMGVSYQF